MLDRIDLEERQDDAAEHCAEVRRASEHNADSQNDDALFEEKMRSYTAQVAGTFALLALRGVK